MIENCKFAVGRRQDSIRADRFSDITNKPSPPAFLRKQEGRCGIKRLPAGGKITLAHRAVALAGWISPF